MLPGSSGGDLQQRHAPLPSQAVTRGWVSTVARRSGRRLAAFAVAVLAAVAVGALVAPQPVAAHLPYPDPSLPVATRVSQLMASMTLDEKIGQMTQAERGAVSNA